MSIKFKNKLIGKRIVLKRNLPTIKNATMIFRVVDSDRKHLTRWMPWEKTTKTIEDSFIYLIDTDSKTQKGEKLIMVFFLMMNTSAIQEFLILIQKIDQPKLVSGYAPDLPEMAMQLKP